MPALAEPSVMGVSWGPCQQRTQPMWILFALIMMVVSLKTFSFSFTLALIPLAIGIWCFSKSNRESLETFMSFTFIIVLIGFAVNILISIW